MAEEWELGVEIDACMVLASLLSSLESRLDRASEKVNQAKSSTAPNECIGRRAEKEETGKIILSKT